MLKAFRARRASLFLLGAIVIVVGAVVYVGYLSARENKQEILLDTADKNSLVGIQPDDHVVGSPSAHIVVIEYGDLECPTCKRYHERAKGRIQSTYIPQDVAFVFRHFPLIDLHKQAFEEAVALECASIEGGEKSFWTYMDLVYRATHGDDTLNLELLPRFAASVGIPREKFDQCIASSEAKARVSRHITLGTLQGIYKTPSFAIFKDGELKVILNNGWAGLEQTLAGLVQE